MAQQNQKPISWQAPEFRHYKKDQAWYITVISISILIVGFFILQKDFFAALSLTIIAALAIFFAKQVPQIVVIELNTTGITFGNLFFPYKQIKHFWIVNNQNHKTLNLHTTAALNNLMVLELVDQDPEAVRTFLIRHIPEHSETDETVAQKIMHRLKF